MGYYRDMLERWVSQIEVSAGSVLDVGGGENPIPNRVKLWNVRQYRILDHDAKFSPDYLEDLNYPTKITEKFDIIFCLEVMEYIFNPLQAHQNLAKLLNDGGVAYISYPTMYPLHAPQGLDYLRYTRYAIEKLLKETGFEVTKMIDRPASVGGPNLEAFFQKEGTHPLKGNKDIFNVGYMAEVRKL